MEIEDRGSKKGFHPWISELNPFLQSFPLLASNYQLLAPIFA